MGTRVHRLDVSLDLSIEDLIRPLGAHRYDRQLDEAMVRWETSPELPGVRAAASRGTSR